MAIRGTLRNSRARVVMNQVIKNVDGSGWQVIFNILKKDGYTLAVVQHPETAFAEDVKFRA
jgi:hypothetical protein